MGIRINEHEAVTFAMGGADVTLPAAEVTRLWLDRLRAGAATASRLASAPRIGEKWPTGEGIYAGMARGVDGQPDYPLIVGEYLPKNPKWQAALDAEKDGWRVPYKRELALCYANVPELFRKEWHWAREQYEADGVCAWAQHFSDGNQDYYLKDVEFAVRLVRSVIVIE